MKRILFAVLFISSVVLAADLSETWSASSVVVQSGELRLLPDGGCSAQAYATYTKQDGGIRFEGTPTKELTGLNRTTCLGLLNPNDGGGFSQMFKQDKGM